MVIQSNARILDGCVLGILSINDYYGYELTHKVQTYISVSPSTMYPVLRRLKKRKWLDTYDQPYQGRNRRYYQITKLGKNELKKIRKEWKEFKNRVSQMIGSENNE